MYAPEQLAYKHRILRSNENSASQGVTHNLEVPSAAIRYIQVWKLHTRVLWNFMVDLTVGGDLFTVK